MHLGEIDCAGSVAALPGGARVLLTLTPDARASMTSRASRVAGSAQAFEDALAAAGWEVEVIEVRDFHGTITAEVWQDPCGPEGEDEDRDTRPSRSTRRARSCSAPARVTGDRVREPRASHAKSP